jgi:hypothetical protein
MKDLTDLKEIKLNSKNDLRLKKEDNIFEVDKIQDELEKLRKEKDYLVTKL